MCRTAAIHVGCVFAMTIDDLLKRMREDKFEEYFVADPEGAARELGFDLRQEATSATVGGFPSRWSKVSQGIFVCFYGEDMIPIGLVYIPT